MTKVRIQSIKLPIDDYTTRVRGASFVKGYPKQDPESGNTMVFFDALVIQDGKGVTADEHICVFIGYQALGNREVTLANAGRFLANCGSLPLEPSMGAM